MSSLRKWISVTVLTGMATSTAPALAQAPAGKTGRKRIPQIKTLHSNADTKPERHIPAIKKKYEMYSGT